MLLKKMFTGSVFLLLSLLSVAQSEPLSAQPSSHPHHGVSQTLRIADSADMPDEYYSESLVSQNFKRYKHSLI